uniref:Uncharacterized protein n=1 Tax=Anguilla anguilla TaxID=7936 RepID=A0A0E9UUM6_ANGAN
MWTTPAVIYPEEARSEITQAPVSSAQIKKNKNKK